MHHARNGFLTAKGLREAAQRTSLEGLAPLGDPEYIDKVGSVSALDGDGDLYAWSSEAQIENQYRRFLNGS